LIRPDPAVCATAGAACGRKSLSSDRIQAIFTSNDTPPGECRLKRLTCGREASAISLYDLCFLAGETWQEQAERVLDSTQAS
ncbi:hypothetical protein P2G62_17575, partial [Paenirhodobacter sp. CAU 1674]|nr:hypothetical protein [Paenirhodobacter sp. CAU 1674]